MASGVVARILLAADPEGLLARLVDGTGRLAAAPMPRWALIGGVAVMAHLAEAHRVTSDIDAVADDDRGEVASALAVIADKVDSGAEHAVMLASGVKIDVITTGAWSPGTLPDDDLTRMFVLAHWWAVQTAAPTELVVVERATVHARAVIPLATPAALVAAKLQSMRQRRRDPAKAASDVFDVYRLLAGHDSQGAVGDALAAAPADLGPWSADAVHETLVVEAERWARRLGVHSRGPAMGSIDPGQLEVIGALCAERIRRAIASP
jgi:hypothetical protein